MEQSISKLQLKEQEDKMKEIWKNGGKVPNNYSWKFTQQLFNFQLVPVNLPPEDGQKYIDNQKKINELPINGTKHYKAPNN